jgi:hypothetical protein
MTLRSGLAGALGALRDRLALSLRLLAAVWLGWGTEEPLDGRLEALLRERLGLLLVGLGHEGSVAEVTEEMIDAAWKILVRLDDHFNPPTDDTAINVYRAMETARRRAVSSLREIDPLPDERSACER